MYKFSLWKLTCENFFVRDADCVHKTEGLGRESCEAQWAHAQRTLHGLHPPDSKEGVAAGGSGNRELGFMAEQAKRRAEIAK